MKIQTTLKESFSLSYTVTSQPIRGKIVDQSNKVMERFSDIDLNSGKVRYRHDGDFGTRSDEFQVEIHISLID